MVQDLREAFDFVFDVCVQCVLGWGVLVEAVLGGLEQCRQLVGEGAVCLPDCGDGAVFGLAHGVVEVAEAL